MSGGYLDTSALLKWYLPEPGSAEVAAYLQQCGPASISLLTKVEVRSALARCVRGGRLDARAAARVSATFEGDIVAGHLELLPLSAKAYLTAESLLGAHPDVGLTTLDALHLGTAIAGRVGEMATADRLMAQAAERAGLPCRLFAG